MAANSQTVLERIQPLLELGRTEDARQLLERAASNGDREAALFLGTSLLTGRIFSRNLQQSRIHFERAATLGDEEALDVSIAFLANGTGGSRDWSAAVQLLDRHAARREDYRRQSALIRAMEIDENGEPLLPSAGQPLSQDPLILAFSGFATAGECEYLIDIAKPKFRPSVVIHPQTKQAVPDPVRTSDYAAFPLVRENPVIHALNRRAASASETSVEQGEPLQVLRYTGGQEYKPHSDALPATDNQRIMTVLLYLNDDYDGGETDFPTIGIRYRGRKGDALLFRDADESGRPEMRSVHAGLPVTRGTKYLASRWIRARPIPTQDSS